MQTGQFQKALLFVAMFLCPAFLLAATIAPPDEDEDPNVIRFLVYVLDVDDIDGAEQNFAANVFVRLRWQDPRLADETNSKPHFVPIEEIWHPRFIIANQFGIVRPSLDELVEIDVDGTVTYRQRYVGRFSQPLRLYEFPFDKHDFSIHFVFPGYSPEMLELVPDAFAADPSVIGGDIAEDLSLPDWYIIKSSAQECPFAIGSTDAQVAGFSFIFTAKRYFNFYFWQAIAPTTLIVMMSWAAFWINPAESGAQLGLAASSILTMIAHRFVMANFLPKLPYMTRLDHFSILSMAMVFLALVEVVITSILGHSDNLTVGKRIDKCSRVLFPVAFVVIVLWSFLG